MKCFTPLILMFFLVSGASYAQNLTIGSAGKPLRAMQVAASQGSPYYKAAFAPSNVVTVAGKKLQLNALRYDVLNKHVEYLDKEVVYEVQDSLSSFELTDSLGKSHVLEKIAADKNHQFFEILVPGKVALLKQYAAKTSTVEDWYTKKKSKSIVHNAEYYILKNDVLEKFNPSKKNIVALFNASSEAKSYWNDNAPDLKTDAGLSEVFRYFNR
jgi:hypothetical protein